MSMRGKGNGVPSNSAHPPLSPISTTLCNIRANSSCLNGRMSALFGRDTGACMGTYGRCSTYRIDSSVNRSSCCRASASNRVFRPSTLDLSSSSWSSTVSRRLLWLREDRYCSPNMRPAATAKRKPSASEFAPFSIALGKHSFYTARASDKASKRTSFLTMGEHASRALRGGWCEASLRSGTSAVRDRCICCGTAHV